MALLLGMVEIYGVISYSVAQRTAKMPSIFLNLGESCSGREDLVHMGVPQRARRTATKDR